VGGGSLLANGPWAAGGFVCKRFASGAGFLKIPHRLVQPPESRVEVGAGLLKRRMAKHVLNMMHRPTCFQESRAAFVSKIVEVQIDGSIGSL